MSLANIHSSKPVISIVANNDLFSYDMVDLDLFIPSSLIPAPIPVTQHEHVIFDSIASQNVISDNSCFTSWKKRARGKTLAILENKVALTGKRKTAPLCHVPLLVLV